MTSGFIGRPQNRVDGRAKVTGEAKYAAEYNVQGLAYGWIVSSTIARGRIKSIEADAAVALTGVLCVFTHESRPDLEAYGRGADEEGGESFLPLRDAAVCFSGQPIALVVAETLELARCAASLVRVDYERSAHVTDLETQRDEAYPPEGANEANTRPLGRALDALGRAEVRHEGEYTHPPEHHNPMEMHATTAVWKGKGRMTIYEKTQGALDTREYLAKVFGFKEKDVRVVASYVGGAFGSGLRCEHQLFLAVLAARELERSVRVALTRQQMFTIRYRPQSIQKVGLGASADGTLKAIVHDALTGTSRLEDYRENDVGWSGALYACRNLKRSYKLAQLDCYTPGDMRAPGGATGVWALESAMDELAHAAGIDPLEFRLKNYSDRDLNEDKPFSSKALRACYMEAAERFGWAQRNPEPRSMREGRELIGWGMATGIWEAMRLPASARAVLTADGKLEVSSATTDIGTGTYTIMTQIAADTLGLRIEDVTFRLGDSSLPEAPVQGGSFTASSVGPAVQAACNTVRRKLVKLAGAMPETPRGISEAMRRADVERIEGRSKSKPGKRAERYAMYIHSAVFVEVRVDEDFGTVRVPRVVSAVAAGNILNPKTARSQVMGGIVWGISMALHEESLMDHNLGRFMNHSYAEYHIPVQADIHDIDVIFVDERDTIINPLGVKGLGEIGIVGTAAAVANAVFHATGRRVRDLPITLDKVL